MFFPLPLFFGLLGFAGLCPFGDTLGGFEFFGFFPAASFEFFFCFFLFHLFGRSGFSISFHRGSCLFGLRGSASLFRDGLDRSFFSRFLFGGKLFFGLLLLVGLFFGLF